MNRKNNIGVSIHQDYFALTPVECTITGLRTLRCLDIHKVKIFEGYFMCIYNKSSGHKQLKISSNILLPQIII